MDILICLSQLSRLPSNIEYILFVDSLSSLHLLIDSYNTNPRMQRIHLTLYSQLNQQQHYIHMDTGHIDFPEHNAVFLELNKPFLSQSLSYR